MVKVQIYFTKKLKLLAIASVLLSTTGLIYFQTAEAATGINSQINFQGKVVNKTAGTNVTNGDYDFTFRLYDAASGGTLLWTENHTGVNDVTVTDGIFRVALGSITSLSSVDFNSDSIYLDITFNGEAMGSRIRFASVPYAFNAEKVNGLSVTNNGGNTLNIAANKTFTVSNTISLSGTDSTSFVFPSTSGGTVIVNNISGQSIAGAFSLTGASGNLTLAGTTGLTFSGVGGDITFTNGEKIDNDTDGTIAITGDLDTSGHGAFGSGTSVDTNTVLNVAETINPSANTRRGLQTIATSNTAFASGALYGGVIRGTGTHTGTSSWIAGLNSQATMTGGGTITQAIGNYGSVEVNNASTGTITNGYVFRGIVNATDGTIDTGYGLRIDSASNNGGTGTINNNYGVSIENQTAGGTTNYGLYIAGASTYALWVDSGISRFDGNIDAQGDILDSSGNLTLNDAVDISGLLTLSNGLTLSGGGAITLGGSTGSGQCLIGGASASWGACGGGSGSTNWVLNSSLGTLSPINNTLDLLLGGTSTASAKFAVLNLNSGTPTATVAGNMVIMPNTALSQAGGFLGIGVASPNDAIDILVNKNGGTVIDMSNYNTGDSAYVGYQAWNNTGSGYAEFGVTGTGYTNTSGWQNMAYLFAGSDTNGLLLSVGGSADPMIFMMDDTSEVARFSGTTKLFGLGTASPISQLHLSRPINADFPVTGKSLAIFDQIENQDIFTASHGGTMRFSITKDGGIRLGQTENEGTSGECLKSGGAGAAAVWDTCGGGSSPFTSSGGLIYPNTITDDFILGSSSISSASFYVDVSAGALYLGSNNTGSGGIDGLLTFYSSGNGISDPTISVDSSGNLTLSAPQSGASVIVGAGTGNVNIDPGADKVGFGTLSPIATYHFTRALSNGATGKALAIFDQIENQDIFTASKSGTTKFVIDQNGNLGLGTSLPTSEIDIVANHNNYAEVSIINSNSGANAAATFYAQNDLGAYMETGIGSSGHTLVPVLQNRAFLYTGSDSDGLVLYTSGADPIIFALDDDESARFSATGLFGLGIASPISKLHVTHDITTFSATGKSLAIFDQIENQDIFTASHGGTMRFSITKDGGIRLGQTENEGTSGECLKSGGAGAAAVWDTCGGGSSVNLLGQSDGLTWIGNTTTDFAIGGTSTSSAKFVFGGSNAGTPTATFSGDLIINNRPTTSVADMQKWTQITGTAGTIGDGSTTGIASISASVVYNGSLYVGTSKTDGAEVYRYDGINSTWTKVSQTTAGTIASGGTANIDMVKSMTTYNGFLYIGTYEPNSAEIYRYDGGTTWTKVSQTTAGTIRSGGTASIDGVSAFGVNNGKLYTGTMEGGKAELYRYDGGTTWTIINTTAGQFVTTNSVAVNAVTNIVSWRGTMFLGTQKNSAADVLRYNGNTGASVFTKLNNNTSGSFTVNGASVTAVNEITNMLVYAGGLVITTAKNNAADVYIYNSTAFTTTVNSWLRLNSSAGTITSGGTANIDNIMSAAVYGGRLYIGTAEANSAQIYRLNADGNWTVVSQNTAGTVSAGGTTGIDAISTLISFNHNSLFSGILEGTSAQGYTYNSSIDQSYALKFNAANSQAGGEQSGQENLGSIFFVASLSANLNNKQGNTGAFVFSHNIVTNYGSYDIAEDYPTRDETLEPGDVVAVDVNEREFVQKSQGAYDYAVIGVYSEKPALRLSQDMEQINGGKAVPVALAGRVPVKVSTENGDIKAGDYLTASSKPGVAMKAKKAGVVIGVAMSSYDGDGIGKVTAFIRSNSYNGSTAEIFTSIDPESSDFSDQVLTQLMNSQTDSKSSVVTDRVIAGLEVITPKITVDTLIAKNIKADSIELPEDFWIKAFSDGGLEIESSSAKEISELKSQIAVLNAQAEAATLSAKSSQEKLIESINEKLSKATESATVSQNNLFSSSLNFDGINIFEGSVRIKGNGLFESMLTVIDTLTSNDLIVNGFSTFFGKTVFKDQVEFERPVAFNSDTGGEVIVKKDERKIEVKFDQEFDQTPIVNVSVAFEEKKDDTGRIISTEELESKFFEQKYEYIIVNKSKTGFTVVLNKKAEDDIYFTWTALQVKDEISLKDRGPN